jgi:hypothetical protein
MSVGNLASDHVSPLTETQIRASFVNTTKGEAKRLHVPRDLADRPWDDLDYLGWRDPQSPARGYLVAPGGDGLRGLALRAPEARTSARRSMCSVCLTLRSGGVSLMVAPRAGKAGQQGHTIGTYLCADLACSLYVRGKLSTGTPGMHETLTQDARIERLVANLTSFVDRVTG